jgi:hypothetical protein
MSLQLVCMLHALVCAACRCARVTGRFQLLVVDELGGCPMSLSLARKRAMFPSCSRRVTSKMWTCHPCCWLESAASLAQLCAYSVVIADVVLAVLSG